MLRGVVSTRVEVSRWLPYAQQDVLRSLAFRFATSAAAGRWACMTDISGVGATRQRDIYDQLETAGRAQESKPKGQPVDEQTLIDSLPLHIDHTALASSALVPMSASAPRDVALGEQPIQVTTLTREALYAELSRQLPTASHDFKALLVAHAWVEQGGRGIVNNNFAGIEFGDPTRPSSPRWVNALTSTVVSRADYEAYPEKYRDWAGGGPSQTIAKQLADGKDKLYVCEFKNRPAYRDLAEATSAFTFTIETRMAKLERSSDPAHQALAAKARGGDADAYAQIVTMTLPAIKDKTTGETVRGFYPYNGEPGYAERIKAQVAPAAGALKALP